MRIVRAQSIRTAKGQTAGESWDKVLKARECYARPFGHCEFYVEDEPQKKVSAVDRVLRAFPNTRPGLCNSGCGLYKHGGARYVTNIPELLNGSDFVLAEHESLHIGTEIATGLPRRFPTERALVKLCWSPEVAEALDADPTMNNPATLGRHLGVQVARQRLENWFTAFLDLGDVLSTPERPPQISEEVAEVIEAIGGNNWSETTFLPSPTERNQIDERMQIANDISESYHMLANRGEIPVALLERLRSEEDIRADTLGAMDDTTLASLRVKNYKNEFARTMRQLGYRYDPGESQPRFHVAKRSSPEGNTILIAADIGGFGPPWSPNFAMVVRGLGWKIEVSISRPYAVYSNDDWARMNRNAAAVIKHLESSFVQEIDRLFGAAPVWLIDFPVRIKD